MPGITGRVALCVVGSVRYGVHAVFAHVSGFGRSGCGRSFLAAPIGGHPDVVGHPVCPRPFHAPPGPLPRRSALPENGVRRRTDGSGLAGGHHLVDALEVLEVGELDHDLAPLGAHVDLHPGVELVCQQALELEQAGGT